MAQKSGSGKISNGLVAAGSAAVLAVYSAGYVRTKSAADRMEQRVAERRPPVRPVRDVNPVANVPSTVPDEPLVPLATPVKTPGEAKLEPTKSFPKTDEKPPVASEHKSEANAPTPSVTPAPAPTPASTPTPVVASTPEPPPVVVAAPPPPPPPPPAPKWKDGTYTGWGTSRHGDIQAQVVIEDGKIKSASIAECRTRYSCDVISKIIPQVAERQSPDKIDIVSGCTQSSDAFYFGVVEALGKAK